ncbi:MAG: hypothetical protein MI922_05055 [Bacteroidales bacterium]|nr:hypothetical protein [Bacteroidales bacterium]
MKKILTLGAFLVVIAGILFLMVRNNSTTLSKKNTPQPLKDLKKITHLDISSPQGEYKIIKDGEIWNSGNQEVKAIKVKALLGALHTFSIYAPVSMENSKAYIDSIIKGGVYLELDKKYRLYLANINNRNIALVPGAEQPYIIEITGLPNINIEKLVTVNDYWFDNYVFTQQVSNIQSIQIKYPNDDSRSFQIQKREGGNVTLVDSKAIDVVPQNMTDYLGFFTPLHYSLASNQQVENWPEGKDYFECEMIYLKDTTHVKARHFHAEYGTGSEQRFIAVLNRKDTVVFQYLDWDPLLITKEYFLKK